MTASAPGSGLAGGGIDRRAAAPHLGLCCACLAYLSRHLEKVTDTIHFIMQATYYIPTYHNYLIN